LSCKKEVVLTFSEVNLKYVEPATIDINIPQIEETNKIATRINSEIKTHIANTLNYTEDYNPNLKLNTAIENFNIEYISFKANFEESVTIWKAIFDD